ncbi:hypothetical protein FVF58_18835 [Paraburkholderia panacisoli]|uniref:Uncharacterized protein n=1 Tax=Paraburkholderia panacisoli TaxID=2603818 RepID=A0A5B0H770_9BURK|nr:hypothetical protein [Paraburkholderia panacisoli]KAA1010904.1 hypothetical protein FVF58_18835 [Paraburkholderia panacisoli]
MSGKQRHSHALQDAVKEVLLRDWDPIGIGGEGAAKEEYDVYVTKICVLIAQRQSVDEVIKYLLWAETEEMGLQADVERARRVAGRLVQFV